MTDTKRIAVIGAGFLAQVRGSALVKAGAEIIGIAARSKASAAKLTEQLGGEAFADYRELEALKPDAVLIEVPHNVMDEITETVISWGCDVLVGAPLAYTAVSADRIAEQARAANVLVEAGFHMRYSDEWIAAKEVIESGKLGDIVAVHSDAFYQGDPARWNYRQTESGGMPLAVMTFFFLNPLRWVLGEPVDVQAIANRKMHPDEGLIEQETCAALVRFENDVLCTMIAGMVNPEGRPRANVFVLGTKGTMDLSPAGMGTGTLTVNVQGEVTTKNYEDPSMGFTAQAKAFVDALDGKSTLKNPAEDARFDIHFSEAIAASAMGQ